MKTLVKSIGYGNATAVKVSHGNQTQVNKIVVAPSQILVAVNISTSV